MSRDLGGQFFEYRLLSSSFYRYATIHSYGFAINYAQHNVSNHLRLACAALLMTLSTAIQAEQTAAQASWVQHPESGDFCAGSYQNLVPSAAANTAYIEADRSEFSFDDTALLQGNVVLRNQGQQVQADSASYDVQQQQLSLRGNLSVQGSGLILHGDSAVLSTDATTGIINNASYVLQAQGARGGAAQIERTGRTSIRLENGFYTYCPPDDNSWQVAAKRIDINHDKGMGVATNATVKVKDVPILVIPYLPFPIGDTRRSGVLWPSFGSASEASGIDYAQPIYWNIAPQADATITPRIIGDRGIGLENEFRYLTRLSRWQVSGSYFTDDIRNKDRWLAALKQSGKFSERWSHSIDYSRVSDDDYFQDYDVTSLDVQRQTHLLQAGQIDYRGERINSRLAIRQFQTIVGGVSEPHDLRPQFSLQSVAQNNHARAEFTGLLEYSDFDTNDTAEAKGQRLYYETGVALPLQWQAGYIRTNAGVKGIRYSLDADHALIANANKPTIIVPSATVDAGLVFEKFTSRGRQTIEPRLVYTYTEFEDQSDMPVFDTRLAALSIAQQFEPSRFSGNDRIDDANQLTLGVSNRHFNRQGRELASIALAQTFYFDDKKTALPNGAVLRDSSSPILGEITLQPSLGYHIAVALAMDKDMQRVERGRWRVSYQNNEQLLLAASQVYNRDTSTNKITDQTEFSAALPINKRWTLYAQHHYDKRTTEPVQNTLGIAYESCCWRVRTLFQQSLDNNDIIGRHESRFFIEFELKGLGGTGAKTDSILAETIYGFEP